MLAQSFDRFYVIKKLILPTLNDLILYPIKYDEEYQYLRDLDNEDHDSIKQNIKDLFFYCTKIRPYMSLYKMHIIAAYNLTAHKILKNKVDLILPKFQTDQRYKRTIFGAIVSGFLGLAFEGISSFLHHKRHRTLQKAVKMMSITMDAQRNKLMHLENLLIMYTVYNAETLSKLVKTVQVMHSCQMFVEQLFAGQQVEAYTIYSKMQDACRVQHYVTNSLMYLQTIKEKYITVYNEFITQL